MGEVWIRQNTWPEPFAAGVRQSDILRKTRSPREAVDALHGELSSYTTPCTWFASLDDALMTRDGCARQPAVPRDAVSCLHAPGVCAGADECDYRGALVESDGKRFVIFRRLTQGGGM